MSRATHPGLFFYLGRLEAQGRGDDRPAKHRFRLVRPALAIFLAIGCVDLAHDPAARFGLGSRSHVAAADADRDEWIGQCFLVPAATLGLVRADIDAVTGRDDPDGGAMRRRP